MGSRRMSKLKATVNFKPPFGADWENILSLYPVMTDDGWTVSIGLIVPVSGFESEIVNWILAEIKSGSRQQFKAITMHETLQMVEIGNVPLKGKGHAAGKELLFNEILGVAKTMLHEKGFLTELMIAKLIKFQIITMKSEELKGDSAGGSTPKQDKSKHTKSLTPENIEPTRQNRLKTKNNDGLRGDIIADEPMFGPSLYVLLFGFNNAELIKMLESVNIPMDSIIKVHLCVDTNDSDKSDDVNESSTEEFKPYQLAGGTEIDKTLNDNLTKFWANLDSVFLDAEPISQLHDVIFQDLEVLNSDVPSILCSTDVQESFRASLYTQVASLMYSIQDLKRQHQNWLNHVKFTHVPSYLDQRDDVIDEILKELGLSADEEIPESVEFDFPDVNHYESLMDTVPLECVTVPVILHCLIEQVVESEKNKGKSIITTKKNKSEESLHTQLEKMFDLCTENYNVPSQFLPVVNDFKPLLISYGDEIKEKTHHLSYKSLDFEEINNSMIKRHPIVRAFSEFPSVPRPQRLVQLARYQNLLALFKPGEITEAEIDWFLKIFTFESMVLQIADIQGNVKKCIQYSIPWDDPFLLSADGRLREMDITQEKTFPISKPSTESARTTCCAESIKIIPGTRKASVTARQRPRFDEDFQSDIECECVLRSSVSRINLTQQSTKPVWRCSQCLKNCQPADGLKITSSQIFCTARNLEDFTYVEYFPPKVFQQVLHEAVEKYQCIDAMHYKRDPCHLVILHNPFNTQKHCRILWKTKLHSNVNLRNFQLHVINWIQEWIEKEETNYKQLLRVQEVLNKKALSDDDTVVTLTPQFSLANILGQPEWIPQLVVNSLKYQHSGVQGTNASVPVKALGQDVIFTEKEYIKLGPKLSEIKKDVKLKIDVEWKKLKTEGQMSTLATASRSRRASHIQPVVTADERWPFQGYDVGNIILHISGSTNYLYPSKGMQICVEKYKYLQGRSRVKITLRYDDNYIFIHPPIDDRAIEWMAESQFLLSNGVRIFPMKIYKPQLRKATSKFTIASLSTRTEEYDEEDRGSQNASSDSWFDIIDDGTKSIRAEKEDLRVPLTLTFPTNLVIQIIPDLESDDCLIRQFFESGDCSSDELCRTITVEGRVIRTLKGNRTEILQPDGTVMKADWTTFNEEDLKKERNAKEFQQQRKTDPRFSIAVTPTYMKNSTRLTSISYHSASTKDGINQSSATSLASDLSFGESAEVTHLPTGPFWQVLEPGGKEFAVQLGSWNYKKLEGKLACKGIDPGTKEEYLTRDDGLHSTLKRNHHLIVHHYDGTRITTYFKNSSDCDEIRVEHPRYVTVITYPEERKFELLLQQETVLTVRASGACIVRQRTGTEFAFHSDGSVLFTPNCASSTTADRRSFCAVVIYPQEEIVLEAFDEFSKHFVVNSNGNISVTGAPSDTSEQCEVMNRRYFVVHPDGGGSELTHNKRMEDILDRCFENSLNDVENFPLPNNMYVEGLQLFQPLPNSWLDSWQTVYEIDSIVPSGLTCRDLQPIPLLDSGDKYIFGYNVGNGLNIRSIEKQKSTLSYKLQYPQVWQMRSFLKFRKLTSEWRTMFRERLGNFNKVVSEIENQKQLAKIVDYRPTNEQQLSASLLALAKATGLPRKRFSADKDKPKPAGAERKPAKTVKRDVKTKFKANSIYYLHDEIRASQNYLRAFRNTNYLPPFFQCQLGKEALAKIQKGSKGTKLEEKFGIKLKTQTSTKKTASVDEKSPPLLKDQRIKRGSNKMRCEISNKLNALIPKQKVIKVPKKILPKVTQPDLPSWANMAAFAPAGDVRRAKFLVKPTQVDFGTLIEGTTFRHRVYLKNEGVESSAIKIRQPPKKTGISVFCSPVLVLPGTQATMDVEIHALMPVSASTSGEGNIYYELEILTDIETIYLPITAKIVVGTVN